jgi:hypothetical protein
MERIYGPNLIGLIHEETGKVDHTRFAKQRTLPLQATYMNIDGIQIDADSTMAILYGITTGMQYTGVTNTSQQMSNCFYASTGIVDNVESLLFSWNNLNSTPGTN